MKRLIVAAMSLVSVLSPAAAADAPANFAGSWTETSVHDMQGMDYPDGTPEDWYGGKTMVVAGDRLSFADDVCYGPTYTHRRGRLSDVLKAFRKDSSAKLKQGFGVDDAGPFDYLEVHCASGQYLSADTRVPPIRVSRGDYHAWFLVKVAPDRIEMPFTHGTWIDLSARIPTS